MSAGAPSLSNSENSAGTPAGRGMPNQARRPPRMNKPPLISMLPSNPRSSAAGLLEASCGSPAGKGRAATTMRSAALAVSARASGTALSTVAVIGGVIRGTPMR